MKDWVYTRKSYINWLSKTKLRKEFSEKIKFDDLSLWWVTNLMNKNNRSDTNWYENLNKKLNNKENIELIKDKIRLEIKKALLKDKIINNEDKALFYKFYLKIKNEFQEIEK